MCSVPTMVHWTTRTTRSPIFFGVIDGGLVAETGKPEAADRTLVEVATLKFVGEVTWLVPSETTTAWEPVATLGIVKTSVDAPAELVVPPEVIVAATPPTVTERAWDAANPVAEMVAEVPTAPVVGVKPESAGTGVPTVNPVGEVTWLVPSETTTAWEPVATLGIVKTSVDAPAELVVPPEVIVAATPPTVTERAWDAANPVAEMVAE